MIGPPVARTSQAEEFLGHIDSGRPWAATRLGLDLLEEEGPTALVDRLLVDVQLESGSRWQRGSYTVAHEHEVTGLVDELLGAASMRLPRHEDDAPTVTMACAVGEWHASAARMMSLRLRDRGWQLRVLGASTPPTEVEQHLREVAPDALLVSCTMTAALVGAAELCAAAHRVGVPVVLGGAAATAGGSRVAAIGADAVAVSAAAAASAIDRWQDRGVPAHQPMQDLTAGERSRLAASRRQLVRAVVRRTPGPFREQDEEEVTTLLATLDAALLLGDADALGRHVGWLRDREVAGRLLPLPLAEVVDQLARSLPQGLPTSRAYLAHAAEQLSRAA